MKQKRLNWIMLVFALSAIMTLGACKKKVPPPPPPPPPPAAAPTASLSASPNTVDKGESTTLTWQTTNATDISVDGIGAVQANGSQKVTPAEPALRDAVDWFVAYGYAPLPPAYPRHVA